MKTIAALVVITLFAAGCQSSPFRGHNDRYSELAVDEDALVYVPESNRGEITLARTDYNKMRDGVVIAEGNVEQGKQQLTLAKSELGLAEKDVGNAMRGLEVARSSNGSVRDAEMRAANTRIDRARARWRSAQSDVAFRAARIDQLEGLVDLGCA